MKKGFLAGAVATVLVLGAGAAAVFLTGFYNIAATEQHLSATYNLINVALRRSVSFHADGIQPPADLHSEERILAGLAIYRNGCRQCHGAPGVAPEDFALGMTPVPINLHVSVRHNDPAEIFWVVKHGLKMSGMPAWDYRMTDDEIWDIVAFTIALPEIGPGEYQRLAAKAAMVSTEPDPSAAEPDPDDEILGDPEEGRRAIAQYGCHACHQIPGVIGREVHVGPPLKGMADRAWIAGVVENRPENMVQWLMDPSAVDPLTAMPALGVRPAHARDIAAYLYTLEAPGPLVETRQR